MGDLSLFLPEAVALLGALVAFAMSVVGVRYRTAWAASLAMALATLVVTFAHLGARGEPFFPGIYRVDAFSQVLKLGIVSGLLLTLLAAPSPGSFRARVRIDAPVFLFIAALGMMMLVSATELLTLFVALELSAYGLYILAALHRLQRTGSEAAAKYILFGAASSAVTIYGISLLYGLAGTTYLSDLPAAVNAPLGAVAILLALAGVLFKLAVFPFHAWAPDAYQGAPHESATFIGTASKVAAVGILARLLMLAVPETDSLLMPLLVLCVASMTVGNLAAIAQNDMKRLLAYSTVAHAGYMLIGLVCFSEMGTASAIFYGLIYVPVAFCAFIVVCAMGADGTNPDKAALAGLYRRSPMLGVALLVGMFGLAGIPPTAGFAGKWFLFSAAIEQGLLWLVLVGAVNATVSLYYYLRVVREAYLAPPPTDVPLRLPPSIALGAWLGVAAVLAVGVYPRPVWDLALAAASALGGTVGGVAEGVGGIGQ